MTEFTLEYPIRVPVRQFIFWKKSTLYAVIGSCTLIFLKFFSVFGKKLKLEKWEKMNFFKLNVAFAFNNAKSVQKSFTGCSIYLKKAGKIVNLYVY